MAIKKAAKPGEELDLSERERIVFDMLLRLRAAPTDKILAELKRKDLKIASKRGSHSLGVLMKYLTAKACQHGYIITMIGGGRGQGNKAVYSMKYYDLRKAA